MIFAKMTTKVMIYVECMNIDKCAISQPLPKLVVAMLLPPKQ